MIKAEELMIGNLINTPEGVKVVDGVATYYKKPVISCDGNSWIEQSISPIELTPSILEKCGFELATGYHLKIGNLRFSYYDDSNEWEMSFLPEIGVWIYMPLKISSLHQLQNLVYILSGTELKITL